MKTFSTVLVSSLLLAAAAAPALAAGDMSGFYVGLDGRIDQIDWKNKSFSADYRASKLGVVTTTTDTTSADNFPEAPMGLGLLFGYRFSPYLAVDGGFSETSDENRILDNKDDAYRYRMTIKQWQVDGYAYWPLGSSGRFRPFLTAGLAYTSGDARLRADLGGTDTDGSSLTLKTYTHYAQKHEFDWRVGTGLEVGISDDVSARLYVRYQPYSFEALKNGVTLGFNLNVLVF